MDHEIPYHLWALKHQAAVETDRAARRAAAPSAALAADQHPLKFKTELACACVQRRTQNVRGSFGEPATKYLPHGATVTGIAVESEQPIGNRRQAHSFPNSREMNTPAFTASGEINLHWGKWRRRNGAGARLFAFALDPGAMSFDESFDCERRRTRRHYDFHTTSVKHAHGETTCAMTLAYDPSLGSVLIGPQR
ncbi:MAG: hypothetical protein QOI59_2572 [Gammaproteobacteria bacterium]|nr:hypothetical protein [Gammaproteobacteria bacterium]